MDVQDFFDQWNDYEDVKTFVKAHQCGWPDCTNVAIIFLNEGEVTQKQGCKEHIYQFMMMLGYRRADDN